MDPKSIQDAEEAAERIRKIREQPKSPSIKFKIKERLEKRNSSAE